MPAGWKNLDMSSSPDDMMFGGEKSAWPIQLTRMQRLIGFIGCYVAGFIVSIIGIVFLFTGEAGIFAALFALGLVISLLSTGFLLGFGRQAKLMFKKVRIVATIVMFVAIILTFVTAFTLNDLEFIALIFAFVAYLSMLWYTLSYIPYARTFVKNIFSKAM